LVHEATLQLQAIAQTRALLDSEFASQGVVEIVGPSLDAMLSFYECIGFRIERRTGPFAVLIGFGIRLFVAENAAAPTSNRWVNVRLLVSNVDDVWGCINALGVPTVHPIGDRAYGLRDFVVRDPSGFEVRFAQVL
jgi:catechol 2,3-dioxygenase-like lactoylglutathione lyase family enzyme